MRYMIWSRQQDKRPRPSRLMWSGVGSALTGLAVAFAILMTEHTSHATVPRLGGELAILDANGNTVGMCPLHHTEMVADISGYVGRIHVRQMFHNPLETKIEAVYVFPLPQDAAVDDMSMTVGDRRIVAQIKPRDEARAIYEAARTAGHVTSLLDQERPNIFTQAVANIEPGAHVVIEISYVETLIWVDGAFEFVFPMVVGPRFIPGDPLGSQGAGWAPDTTQVPDASRISPPVAPPGTRAGHDIRVTVHLDAGMAVSDIISPLHAVEIERHDAHRATITLSNHAVIPNKDFILHYRTASNEVRDALLVHRDARGAFFTLILQPPQRVLPEQVRPKEMIFVIDRSGSMSGFPIEKAKETMRLVMTQMNPHDTFNLLSFAGGTGRCFSQPVPNTPQNRAIALQYLADLYGSGGTQMMPAILEALGGIHDPRRVRIVAFMTDGYIGNDFAIIDAVQKHADTSRVFAFGIGNAVNRFLLDGMAHVGRGAVEYVTLQSQAEEASKRFHQRIHAPVLTDIAVDWGTLAVAEVYPRHIPDLFSNTPIMIHGRLTGRAEGTIVLRGHTGSGAFVRRIHVQAGPTAEPHEALASLWARAKVKGLMMQDYASFQSGNVPEQRRQEITATGVTYRLMTPFTSFVAVEEMTVTVAGQPTTIAVPVDIPDGVSYTGIFGRATAADHPSAPWSLRSTFAAPSASRTKLYAQPMVVHERAGSADATVRQEADPNRQDKLAEVLRGLEQKVMQEGTAGTLTVGQLRVINYTIDVMIYLRDTSVATLQALRQLGFMPSGESKVIRLVIGAIDVRRLPELAQLESVLRIIPMVS